MSAPDDKPFAWYARCARGELAAHLAVQDMLTCWQRLAGNVAAVNTMLDPGETWRRAEGYK